MQKKSFITPWLFKYKKKYLGSDISAGLTVGIMLIPQGIAYASVAGMPAVYGLYAAMIPQFTYALLGTSRQVSVGPVAIDSMLIAAAVSSIASSGEENYVSAALTLTFLIGILQLLFGIIRLGFLVNFMSKPVISGFTSAAAFVIGIDQLKNIFGVSIAQGGSTIENLWMTITQYNYFNWIAIILGIVGILLIRLTKKISAKIPGSLIAVITGLAFVYFFSPNIAILGEIPSGLPSFKVPDLSVGLITSMFPSALAISLIGYMESISVSKALQNKHKGEYQIDNNQEFIALGLGDVVSSLFGGFHGTGGFSRSAVNNQAGAKTNLANVISGLLLGLALLFLMPIFKFLPKTIIASIILVAVYGLIDTDYPKLLWKTKREDFYMLAFTFLLTLFVGIQIGIISGMILSIILLIRRTATPHIAVLEKLEGCNEYRNKDRFTDIEARDDILIIRQDAQLYFANSTYFYDRVMDEAKQKGKGLKLLVLHFGSVSNIDSTALASLEDVILELKQQGVKTYFSDMIGPVRDFLSKVGLIKNLGKDHFFLDVQSAIDFFDQKGNDQEIKINFERAIQSNEFKERNI
ncbi:sulfate permease [Flammeovirga pectinis]|uniref:Sulfate permease n=1 Tax=Flammeovirga pectinis TaxID=2494373 RepID=A0A3S9P2M7_9BACT|nr:sulfate permease [Flammeovirga pectinis]AZQ62447.1 sulfate permease [Flammeovirga pectinis]